MWSQWKHWRVQEATWVPFSRPWLPLPQNPDLTQKKKKKKKIMKPRDPFDETDFKLGFENVKFWTKLYSPRSLLILRIDSINGSLASSSFSASCSRIVPLFTAGKRIGVCNRHATRVHVNDNLHSYGLWTAVALPNSWVAPSTKRRRNDGTSTLGYEMMLNTGWFMIWFARSAWSKKQATKQVTGICIWINVSLSHPEASQLHCDCSVQ
jgi:hypothetical protein